MDPTWALWEPLAVLGSGALSVDPTQGLWDPSTPFQRNNSGEGPPPSPGGISGPSLSAKGPFLSLLSCSYTLLGPLSHSQAWNSKPQLTVASAATSPSESPSAAIGLSCWALGYLIWALGYMLCHMLHAMPRLRYGWQTFPGCGHGSLEYRRYARVLSLDARVHSLLVARVLSLVAW